MIIDSLGKSKYLTVAKGVENPMFLLSQSAERSPSIGFPLWDIRAV